MMDRKVAPQLYELSKVVPKKFVKPAPKGKYGQYVSHYVIVQRLLATVGPFDWELVEVLRGDSKGIMKGVDYDLHGVIVGVVYRLTCTIDSRRVPVEEAGEVDAYTKTGDGARLKHATSDALKRCAMRLGVAIQLWCKTPEEHFLPRILNSKDEEEKDDSGETMVGGEDQDEPEGLTTRDGGYSLHPGISHDVTHATVTEADPQDTLTNVPKLSPEQTWIGPQDDPLPDVPESSYPAGAKPLEVELQPKPPPDTWNQLLATLENLPDVTDTRTVWIKHAKQLTGRMVLAGLWKETDAMDLTKLSKQVLVEKVTTAHQTAKKKVDSHAKF